jgi:hypothetical protein
MADTETALATRDARKDKFVEAYAANAAGIAPACQVAGISRSTYKRWRNEDPDFDQKLEEAKEAAVDEAEAEVRRRGVEGVQEPVIHKGAWMYQTDSRGELVLDGNFEPIRLTVNKKSDRMLELYVRANRAEYRDRGETTVNVQGGLSVRRALDLEDVPTGQLEAVKALLEEAMVGRDQLETLPSPENGIYEVVSPDPDPGPTDTRIDGVEVVSGDVLLLGGDGFEVLELLPDTEEASLPDTEEDWLS